MVEHRILRSFCLNYSREMAIAHLTYNLLTWESYFKKEINWSIIPLIHWFKHVRFIYSSEK